MSLMFRVRGVRTRAQAGGVSLLALFLAFLLAGLSVGLVQEGFAARANATRQETNLQALELAELALARAEVEVRSQVDGDGNGIGTVRGSYAYGTYEAITNLDPASPDRFLVRARGTKGLCVRRLETGVRRRSRAFFVEGLFSQQALVVDGNQRTDAYDSRLGSYASQATNLDGGGPYAQPGGNLGSNEGIRVNGGANYLRGNVIPGPGYELDASGGPVITGDSIPREVEIPLPVVPYEVFAAAAATNANGTWNVAAGSVAYDAGRASLRVNANSTVVLPGGTYFFSDLTLRSGATLQFTGPSRVYATGSVDLSAGTLVNATGSPTNLLMYVHPYALPAAYDPPTTEVKIAGHPQAALGLYAPEVPLTVSGNSHLFGAAVASEIKINGNTFFHYDKALGDIGLLPGATFERLFWRDVAPPPR